MKPRPQTPTVRLINSKDEKNTNDYLTNSR